MSIINTIKLGIGAVRYAAFGKRRPVFVMFCVTNKCPYHCKYCNIPMRDNKELSLTDIKGLVMQIKEAGAQILALWGGEPLLRDDIGEIIDYAKSKGLMVIMDSTGYGIEDKIDKISHLDKLVISFDGPEEICEKYKGKGSFKSMIAAFDLASEKRMDTASFTVLTKDNIHYIEYILDTARKYKFQATFKIPHLNDVLGKNRDDVLAGNEDYKKAIKKLIKEKRCGAPVANSLKCLNFLLSWPDFRQLYSENKKNGPDCAAGKLFCNIDTDGAVYPCPAMVGSMDVSGFLDTGFANAFKISDKKDCKSCCISFLAEQNFLLSLNLFKR